MKAGMDFLINSLRKLVLRMAGVVGAGLLTMVAVTALDVILGKLGHPLPGPMTWSRWPPE